MKILLVTNVMPNTKKHSTPIVKNIYNQYIKRFPEDNIKIFLFDKSNLINSIKTLRKTIKDNEFDILHNHFGGWSSFLTSILIIDKKCKKILTFHGTDIHANAGTHAPLKRKLFVKINSIFSYLSFFTYDKLDFVSNSLLNSVPKLLKNIIKNKIIVSVLSVDYTVFFPMKKEKALEHLNLDNNYYYLLFVNNNNSAIKNEKYANEIICKLGDKFRLLKMSNISYEQVPYYVNASFALLITSEMEGSPNIVREAIACNVPIISTDVGDIKEYIKEMENSIIIEKNNAKKASKKIIDNINLLNMDLDTHSFFKEKISYSENIIKTKKLYNQLIQKEYNEN